MPYTLKKTFDTILGLKCHFLCQVKRNCRKLWESCALFTALAPPLSVAAYYQEGHGNQIYRQVWVFDQQAALPKGWQGIRRIVKVRRWGFRQRKEFDETTYYVLSKPIDQATLIAEAIRGHWGIENQLHWLKDVHLKEDEMRAKNKNQVIAWVYFNNIVMSLLRAKGIEPNIENFDRIVNKIEEIRPIIQ